MRFCANNLVLPADAVCSVLQAQGLNERISQRHTRYCWNICMADLVGQDKAERRYRDIARSLGCVRANPFSGDAKETLPFYQLSRWFTVANAV